MASPRDALQLLRASRTGSKPHRGAALQARSTVRRVASWRANQARGAGCGQPGTSEHLFQKCLPLPLRSDYRNSAAPSARSGRRNRRSTWRSAQAFQSAARDCSSKGIASRTLAPFTRSTVRSSKTTKYPRGVRYRSQVSLRIGRRHFGADDLSLAALSARLALSLPGGDTASSRRPTAGVGTIGAASASASRSSFLLAPADPATDKGARGDDRAHAPPASIQSRKRHLTCAMGASGCCNGSVSGVTAGETALVSGFIPPGPGLVPGQRYRDGRLQRELPSPRLRRESGGVTPTAQMTQVTEGRRAEVQGCAAVVSGVESLALNSSSGGGLGIHQPGSNTRGFAASRQSPSGRAAEAATCPAVARFNQGRV